MASAEEKFDHFLADIFQTDGADGVVDCFQFLFGAFVITRDGIVIGANAEFIKMIEYPSSELYGMSALDLIAEDERAEMIARFAAGNTERYELKLLPKSKKVLDVLVAPRTFNAGGQLYRLAEFVDNTAQKKSQLAITESEQKFQSVFEQAAVGIARVSPAGTFLEVNQKLCDIVGYSKEELIKITFQKITHPNDLDIDLSLLQQMLNNERDTYKLEKRYFHKNGSIIWISFTASLIKTSAAEPKYFVAVIEDISARKKMEHELINRATHVALTGLCNRTTLNEKLDYEIDRASRYSRSLSLMMIDIDHFKLINDNYGHQTGDNVLIELGKIFKKIIRRADHAGRFGGEEFLLVLPELDNKQALVLAERLRQQVEALSVKIGEKSINVTVSIGISSYPENGKEVDSLIKACDDAMYKAKENGRNLVFSA